MRDDQILAALQDLPPDLPKTFERILLNSGGVNDMNVAIRIFRWVTVAKRPLTLPQLQEAIAVEPLQETWEPRSVINDMRKAVACCGNLIFVEEEEQSVHFTHSSVKDFLLSQAVEISLPTYHIGLDEANADASAICITYLNLNVFNTQVTRTSAKKVDVAEIPSMVMKRSSPLNPSANKIALSLLIRRGKSGTTVSRLLQEMSGEDERTRGVRIVEQHPFLLYARKYWLEHSNRLEDGSGQLWMLWRNLLEQTYRRDCLLHTPWTPEEWKEGSTGVLNWIVERNHYPLTLFVSTSNDGLARNRQFLLFQTFAEKGKLELIELIWRYITPPNHILGAALTLAAEGGYLAVVDRLLQEKADVNAAAAAGYEGRTALQAAAGGGHLSVVDRLLQEKADVNAAAAAGDGGRTALQAASEGGHLAVVDRLRVAGAR